MSEQLDSPTPEDVAEDLLDGVPAIAAFTGWSDRRCYYLLQKGLLPSGKIGNRYIGSKRVYREFLTKIASGLAA